MVNQIVELKEQGNNEFKAGNFKKAIKLYNQAAEQAKSSNDYEKEYFTCINNRSQCYLNLGDFEKAVEDSSLVLIKNPNDTKALYRRSKALKELNKLEDALLDAKRLISIDAKNKVYIEHIQSIRKYIEQKATEQNSLKNQAKSMLDFAIKEKGENQITSLNNLIVLAREDTSANELISQGVLTNLLPLLSAKDAEVVLAATRVYACLCKNSFNRAKVVFNTLQFENIARLISSKNETISTAASNMVQNIIYAVTDLDEKRKKKKPVNVPFEFSKEQKLYIDEIFRALVSLMVESSCSGYGRDNCIDLCLKFFDTAHGCAWTPKFIVTGVPKLLRIGGVVPELSDQMPITEHTKMHVACCLSAVYDDCHCDAQRDEFLAECDKQIRDYVELGTIESKLKGISALACLLQGPFDVGNQIIGKNNLIGMMLEMASSNDVLQETVAVEAVVFSASKKDKASGMLTAGLDVLKKLYQSSNKKIKVRALVGLCKLASSKGTDASMQALADGSILKLEKACRKFLCASADDYDTKKWAADGLAYLTLDAEVKEELANDNLALPALYSLTKKDDKNTLYSVATILANLCNAYEIKKPDPELIELAKYAKHHVPELHERDQEEFVKARRQRLMDSGIASALVAMSKHNSQNCRELLSWTFCVLSEDTSNRGKLVAAGAGKALIPMALDGTTVGRTKASQALAKIAISTNPEISFPGQRVTEVVRPLLGLLHPDRTALENFEALMALTNLASVNSTTRKQICKDDGFMTVEQYMYDDNDILRRASVECMCNLVQEEEVVERFTRENDRVKLLVLYCGNEDLSLCLAAAGTLAQLSFERKIICEKILAVKSFFEIFKEAACSTHVEFQFRIFYILNNIISIDKDMLKTIVQSEIMDVIVALTRIEVENERERVSL